MACAGIWATFCKIDVIPQAVVAMASNAKGTPPGVFRCCQTNVAAIDERKAATSWSINCDVSDQFAILRFLRALYCAAGLR
jgi:hypothetical protein